MKRLVVSLLACLMLQPAVPPQVLACGDKFLVQLDRDFQKLGVPLGSARRKGTILVYRTARSGSVPAGSDLDLLRRVGHKIVVCDTARLCSRAIADGVVQVVLIDSRDVDALGVDPQQAQARILPVVAKGSREDKLKMKERYGAYFDSAAPPGKLLAMVDRMLADQNQARTPRS